MTREELAKAFSAARGDALVVVSPGATNGLLYRHNPDPGTIYNMELAYTSPFALGMAYGAPDRQVVALDGDGSFCAGVVTLGTIVRHPPTNLTVVIVANGIWGTGDGTIETTIRPVQFAAIATAWGWDASKVVQITEAVELENALRTSLREPGPWLISAQVGRSSADASYDRPLAPVDAVGSIYQMRARLGLQP